MKDFTPKFSVKQDTHLLVRISIDKIMKCTNPQIYKANQKPSKKGVVINFGDVRYFSVKVPNQQSDARNRIVLELVGFEGPKDLPRLFGSLTVHLYDVIQKQSFTKVYPLRIRSVVFCMVEVEFMFCYGSLGYGYSHQLKLPGADPAKAVACSMFMRVPPPKDRRDHTSNVIKPQLMDYPAVLSSDFNVTVGNLELEAPSKNVDYELLQKALKEPPRERLVQMKQEYRNLKTWREKAEYLDQLILKRGPKTKPGFSKVSRFKQAVGKVQSSSKENAVYNGVETILHEEKQPEFMMSLLESGAEILVFPSPEHEIPVRLKQEQTDSDTDSEKDRALPESMETGLSVPALTVTSTTSAATHISLDITESMERKITSIEFPRESETSLSSSSGIPGEFTDSHIETADSETTVVESLEGKAVEEELATPAEKECQQLVQESPSRLGISVIVPDEIEAPKPSGSFSEPLLQWPWKEVEFQEAVFSGDKFEPFLRNLRGVQAPVPTKGKDDEMSIFSHLEKPHPRDEIKEQEDQDPPLQMSPTREFSSVDTKFVKSDKQLSILRLIENNIELQEEEPGLAIQEEEEQEPPAVKPHLMEKQLGEKRAESELQPDGTSLKRSIEDFLVNRLMKVIALKSLLSKNVEILVEERLLTDEIAEELEDSMNTEDGLPEDKRKQLLVGRKPCSAKRLSELDIKNLKAAASQNLQASLLGKLSSHGIIPGMEAAENIQEVSVSSSVEEDAPKWKKHLSKERLSQTDIITLKSLSDSQSGDSESVHGRQGNRKESTLHRKSQSSPVETTNVEMDSDKEHSRKSLEIIRVTLPMSTETELTKKSLDNIKFAEPGASPRPDPNKTANDTLIEKLLKAEIVSLKSFLSKGLQDHLQDRLPESGLSTKEDFEKMCQTLSSNAKDELKIALEKALPEGCLVSSVGSRPEIRAMRTKSQFSESIQNYVLETLSESEIANLKSILNKKIQDHLLERLSEIGLITEEELRKVLGNFFPVVAEETPLKGVSENVFFKRGGVARSTSSLTQSLQDRFSEDELSNLKSLLNRLLKEDQRDKLSESEIKGLSSVLQKNFKDLPIQSSSETGISKAVEIKDEFRNIALLNAEDSSPGGATVEVSGKERSPSKDRLSKPFSDAELGLGAKPDLSVNSVFEEDTVDRETQTRSMPILKRLALKAEKTDPSIHSVLGPETTHKETQTASFILPPKKVKKSSKKESHRLQSSEKLDMPTSKRTCDTLLKTKPADEPLKQIAEPFTSSSFLSVHDIGIQTEIKNFLSRPPGYLPKPTFPVNPQTFLFLHSESEDEARLAGKHLQKPRSKRKLDKSSKKETSPHPLQQVGVNPQLKKEKSTGAVTSKSKDVLKEKVRRHCESHSSKLTVADSKKDIKATASPSVLRKESLKQKSEKKREEAKPKKSFSKTAVLADPSLQNLGKAFLDKLSVSDFPASWHTKGNTPSIPFDLDMETFKHLEKAIERALVDLGKAPEGSPGLASYSARASTVPGPAMAAELLRSIATNSSTVENPRISASSLSEMSDDQERTFKMSPELLEVVLWILQNTLRQNTRSQSNG